MPDVTAVSPAMLLRADVEATAFQAGRERTLASLRAWAETGPQRAAQLITAPGGAGKSRLARELGHRMRTAGWAVLHLRDDPRRPDDLDRLRSVRIPLLVVVDYAETRRRQLDLLAECLPSDEPVRVLMLARGDDGWRDAMRPGTGLFKAAEVMRLDPLYGGGPHTYDVAEVMATEYAKELKGLDPTFDLQGRDPRRLVSSPHGSPDFRDALGLHMHVLGTLLDHAAGADPGAGLAAEGRILDHEGRYWSDTAREHGLNLTIDTMRSAVAAASLVPADGIDAARSVLATVPGLRDLREDERLKAANWLRDLYPGGTHWWGSLQPDRLAEWLFGERNRSRPDVLPLVFRSASTQGGPIERYELMRKFRAIDRRCADLADEALDLLRRELRDEPHPDQERLELRGSLLAEQARRHAKRGELDRAVEVKAELVDVARLTSALDPRFRPRLLEELRALAIWARPDEAETAKLFTTPMSPSQTAVVFRELHTIKPMHNRPTLDPPTEHRRTLAVQAVREWISRTAALDGESDRGRVRIEMGMAWLNVLEDAVHIPRLHDARPKISEHVASGGARVIATGRALDVYTGPMLRDSVKAALSKTDGRLIIDMTLTRFIDSTGLGVLIGSQRRAREAHVALIVVCSYERILFLMRITGTNQVLDIVPDIDAAHRRLS
ncbi:STAS domain-containing protein [Phytomonospora endophytica]|uniref:Anti-sigma factor antagonist n=1 Tax=Phytomonospora endophytica TaxID=714109 RepID=A0A841FHC8_9ACTN|nr:STAS domain-containing protein [Phytomonospora endophytica]MBB6036731.1 anti-anti-sigma factor [Phytomonospora endophytica]